MVDIVSVPADRRLRASLGHRTGGNPGSVVVTRCEDVRVRAALTGRVGLVASIVAWAGVLGAAIVGVAFDERLRDVGRDDLVTFRPETWTLIAAIVSSLVVGTALVVKRSAHPVGWCFLALAVSMQAAGALDGYGVYGAVALPGAVPGAGVATHLGDAMFAPWMAIVGLVLHLTPTGRPLSRRWRRAAIVMSAGAVATLVSAVFGDRRLEPPLEGVRSGLRVDAASGVFDALGLLGTSAAGIGLLVSGASLVVRYRRSTGIERQQLHWMYLAVVPLPLFVPAAFLSAWTNHPVALLVSTAGFLVVIPVAAGLAVSQYHLYEVDRILSRALTYALLTAALVGTYAVIVLAAGRAIAGLADASAVSAVAATFVTMTVAAPLRSSIQDALDRRFNRRRFDASRVVMDELAQLDGRPVDEVLCRAAGDFSLVVAYWSEQRGRWSTAAGLAASPGPDSVELRRHDQPVARISFDAATVDRDVVEAAAKAALTELDNTRLRAEIAAQLVEVQESRARIVAAQTEERRRIERNLHDGAQQRLLALAMNLRAAHLNGGASRARTALEDGIDELQATVTELRDLANGLHPAILQDGGLSAALDDLARRSSHPIDVVAPDGRFDDQVEACVWFTACEAIANAHKHAAATSVHVHVHVDGTWLELCVADDGRGGADASGSGLQGVRDRVEALGGSLIVDDRRVGGTELIARLPCGS